MPNRPFKPNHPNLDSLTDEQLAHYNEMMDLVANDPLQKAAQEMKAEGLRRFVEPRFTLSAITSGLGIPEVTIRNWLTRNQIDLGASEGHQRGKWRMFSIRDVLVIAACFHLSRIGVPVSIFATVYRPIVEYARTRFSTAMGMVRRPVGLLTNDGEWNFAISFDSGPFHVTDGDGPAIQIVVDFDKIIDSTLNGLGMPVRTVTASEAAEMLRASQASDAGEEA